MAIRTIQIIRRITMVVVTIVVLVVLLIVRSLLLVWFQVLVYIYRVFSLGLRTHCRVSAVSSQGFRIKVFSRGPFLPHLLTFHPRAARACSSPCCSPFCSSPQPAPPPGSCYSSSCQASVSHGGARESASLGQAFNFKDKQIWHSQANK